MEVKLFEVRDVAVLAVFAAALAAVDARPSRSTLRTSEPSNN